MNVIDMPASEPSSAARGVIRRMTGPMKPPIIRTKLCTNTQVRPASHAWTGSFVVARIGSMTTNVTTNMCGTLMPGRQRANVVAPGLLREPIGEPGVVTGAEAQHQPGAGRMRPNTSSSGIFSTKRKQPRQHEQVDEDVGAEAEERVPVAGHPEFHFALSRIADCRRGHHAPPAVRDQTGLRIAAITSELVRPSRKCRPGP